ncbi:MAG: SAM-dependent chlorinase/fluorinase [Arenicellales bacterium]|nr:SAM-dependent chlorinase/fluorinase [Arenicellales bacterium]
MKGAEVLGRPRANDHLHWYLTIALPIVLFTDFGRDDIYVGQLHARAQIEQPGCCVIDLFHCARPFDPACAGTLLAALLPHTPPASVLLAIVDPGVGSERLGLALKLGERWLVGPDNGLFSCALSWTDERPQYWTIRAGTAPVATTFHGRDVFLPAVVALTVGDTDGLLTLADASVSLTHSLVAQCAEQDRRVVHIDHYGNVITGVRGAVLDRAGEFSVAGRTLCFAPYFDAVPPGQCFWHVNSIGLVEFSANRASAAELLGLVCGDRLEA